MSQYEHERVEIFVLHWSDSLVDVPGSESLPEMNMLYGEIDRWNGLAFQEENGGRCRFGWLA